MHQKCSQKFNYIIELAKNKATENKFNRIRYIMIIVINVREIYNIK